MQKRRYHRMKPPLISTPQTTFFLAQDLALDHKILESLFGSSPDALLVVDPERKEIIRCNHQALRLFECEQEGQLLGKYAPDELQSLSDKGYSIEKLQRLSAGKTFTSVCTLKTRKGRQITAEMSFSWFEAHGSYYEIVRIIDRSANQQAFDLLASSEAQLRSILESTPSAVLLTDPQLNIKEFNGAFELFISRFFRKKPYKEQPVSDLFRASGKNRPSPAWMEHVHSALAGSSLSFRDYLSDEQQATHAFDVTIRPVFQNGAVSGLCVFIHQITELLRAEQELKATRQQAIEARQNISRFLSVISHELRNPLSNIIGFTHLLLDDSPTPAQLEHLEPLKFAADNLMVLVNDLLDYNKIQAGKIEFEQTDFSLRELMRQLIAQHRHKAKERENNLRLVIDPAVPEGRVIGDPHRLAQVLTNLLGNAVKFTHKGTICLHARVAKQTEENISIYFTVKDTGPGIPADRCKSIFEPFVQAGSSVPREFGGSGLGLSIVKKLLELQGCELRLKTEVGRGTRFGFVLTFTLQKEKEVQPDLTATVLHQPPVMLENARILMAEDNKINQLMANGFLQKWGVSLEMVDNGQQAVESIQRKQYDLVLMDLQMPVMDGMQAVEAIRALPGKGAQELPIIALTAAVMDNAKEQLVAKGFNDVVPKPFTPDELYHKLLLYLPASATVAVNVAANAPRAAELSGQKPILSMDALEPLAGSDAAFRKQLVQAYVEFFSEFSQEYRRAFEDADRERHRKILHKAKFPIDLLRMDSLAEAIQQGKTLMQSKRISEKRISQHVQQTDQLVTAILAILQHELNSIKNDK